MVQQSQTVTAWLTFFERSISEEYVKQRAADPAIESAELYQTARQCISECLLSHDKRFERFKPSDQGTRPIGGFRSWQGAITPQSWGKGPVCCIKLLLGRTRSEPRNIFQPKTLQDALFSAKQLGIPYLWINSLCIIQKDNHDKAQRSQKCHRSTKRDGSLKTDKECCRSDSMCFACRSTPSQIGRGEIFLAMKET